MTQSVIDLDFEGTELFEADLVQNLVLTPKGRRLERRRKNPSAEFKKGIKKSGKGVKKPRRKMIEFAMDEIGKEWKEALDEDHKEKTTQEILELLLPRSSAVVKAPLQKYQKKLHKEYLVPY